MNIIEQATRRLEELQRSGIDVQRLTPGNLQTPPVAPLTRDLEHRPHVPLVSSSVAEATLHELRPREPATSMPEQAKVQTSAQASEVEIDVMRLRRMGYLLPNQAEGELATQFRHIKRPLLRNVDRTSTDDASVRSSLIMVTSAVAGEGKTFCSINLAMSIAMEVDSSVLLVDADVVRPAVLDRLGLQPRKGLLDVLDGEVGELSEVILRTSVPKLSILPAGVPRAMATELLASAAMDRLLADLSRRYPDRVVILDAPPLLLAAESTVLASRVGQVIVVVDSSRTSVHKVEQAFASLESCPTVLSLLNKCHGPESGAGYGYGY